jgi:hypothetical protein
MASLKVSEEIIVVPDLIAFQCATHALSRTLITLWILPHSIIQLTGVLTTSCIVCTEYFVCISAGYTTLTREQGLCGSEMTSSNRQTRLDPDGAK